ncbi:MAG: phosphoglycerate dehydrogenase [Candidatus Marinimicrobia bacterium]|nr:phosphoglycerate dehydrogenase [Candidatus Neomarinimicrobiota bacterium]
MAEKFFIFDFDRVFVNADSLYELAKISLKKHPDRRKLTKEIKNLINAIRQYQSDPNSLLIEYIDITKPSRGDVDMLVSRLKKQITSSFLRNKEFFESFSERIYVVSDSFREYMEPVLEEFYIHETHIFGNKFVWESGKITGFDKGNPLSSKDGKLLVIKDLQLPGNVYLIGANLNDREAEKGGIVKKFFFFIENFPSGKLPVATITSIPSLDEFLFVNKLPMSISYPKNRIKVLLLEGIHRQAYERFREEGYSVEVTQSSLNEEELIERIKDVSILGIRSRTHITQKAIDNAQKLIAIGAFCIGTNQIDLDYCTDRGIAVFNAPFSNTRSVVELVVGEIIMLMRNVFEKSSKMHRGIWDKSAKGCREIRGKKLGIIGYGNIGSQLSVLAESMGMEVYFYDIQDKLPLGNAKKVDSIEELLKKVDVVSVHVDGRPANRNLISEREFGLMKKGVIFINTSRGFVVDIDALRKNLDSGKVKGAAVDVFPEEPKRNYEENFYTALRGYENVILTPHIGGSTEEAQKSIAEFVPEKIINYVNTGSTISSVNFPELALPELNDAHRLIHIHRNVPGVLARINSIFSKYNINIVGQYLKTNEKIGYVITDVSREYDKNLIKEIKSVPETIKFRVLY